MNAKRITVAVLLFLLPVLTAGAEAQSETPPDPCASDLRVEDFFNERFTQLQRAKRSNDAAMAAKTAQLPEESNQAQEDLKSRANGDGLNGGSRDFLRQGFVALGLGTVEEGDGKLVFNFNSERTQFGIGKLSPRITIYDPTLFAPLADHFDMLPEEDGGSAQKAAAEKGLQDLSDVEARLGWLWQAQAPRAEIQRYATEMFNTAYQNHSTKFKELLEKMARFSHENGVNAGDSVKAVCARPDVQPRFLELVAATEAELPGAQTSLKAELESMDFFTLADLAEGEPKWIAEGTYRYRDGAAGPDQFSVEMRYEVGNVSFRGFRAWAKRTGKSMDVASYHEYRQARIMPNGLPQLRGIVKVTETAPFTLPLTAGDFTLPKSRLLTGMLQTGTYLSASHTNRLDLDLQYERVVSGDEMRNKDRRVANLTFTQQMGDKLASIAGGPEFVATLVWANKPEFRGEVDQELGLKAGLKWSMGKPKTPPQQ